MDYHLPTTQPEAGAMRNLATLKKLLSSSSPGDTPASLATQPQTEESHDNQCREHDISHEIEDLIRFVDNFEFGSPKPATTGSTSSTDRQVGRSSSSSHHQSLMKPKQIRQMQPRSAPAPRRDPLFDRTNESLLEGTKSNLSQKLLLKEDFFNQHQSDHFVDGGEGTFQSVDQTSDPGSLLIPMEQNQKEQMQIQLQDQWQDEEPVVSEDEWEKFQSLVKQVELALQEAWKERDEAKSWAKEVRLQTQSWVEEQRKLIEREHNALREAQQAQVEAQADETQPNHNDHVAYYEARIEGLESSLEDLKAQFRQAQQSQENSESHHQTTERRLLGIIERMEEERQSASISASRSKQQLLQQQQQHRGGVLGTVKEQSPHVKLNQEEATPWRSSRIGATTTPRPIHQQNHFQSANLKHMAKHNFNQRPGSDCFITPVQGLRSLSKNHRRGASPGSMGLRKSHPHITTTSTTASRKQNSAIRILTLPDGTQKEIRPGGATTVKYPNRDVKIISPSGSVAYYHSKSQVIQVSTEDGSDIYEFPDKQVERHYPDGRKIVRFPDGTKKRFFPNGAIESFLPCGNYLVVEDPDGTNHVKHL